MVGSLKNNYFLVRTKLGELRYMFFKNIELHKKYKKDGALRKKEATETINFGFFKPEKEKFISSKKKLLLILKTPLTRRKILLNMQVRLIDQYVASTYTETMLRNVPRKISRRCFVRNQGWCDTVVNNYSHERFMYTFRISRKTFNYILENIQGESQKQIATELPISREIKMAICLYKLTRGNYQYVIGEMAGIA